MAQRMLLFGGTFDPVHHGHLIVARAVAEARHFERVTLVPAGRRPGKDTPEADAENRLAMLRLAVEADPQFDLCPMEIERPGPSYTVDTLTALRAQHGADAELHWLIGADMLAELPTWHRAREVVDLARMVVVARPPMAEGLDDVLESLRREWGDECAHRLAEGVTPAPLIDISSTLIRSRVAAGKSIRYLVPPRVGAYIENHHLYRADS